MKVTNTFLGTLREAPAEATKDAENYKLMLRGGIIRKHNYGEYNLLPLGIKVYNNLKRIINEKFEMQGFIENEVEIEDLLPDVKTYKQFPFKFYSVKDNLTNEKPKYGLMKSRKFSNVEGLSLHRNIEELNKEYEDVEKNLLDIFNRIKIQVESVEGYCNKQEKRINIVSKSDLGDELVVECDCCTYKSSMNSAESMIEDKIEQPKEREIIYTPEIKSIDDLSNFFKISSDKIVKTLIVKTKNESIAVLVRGDRELDSDKLKKFLQTEDVEMGDSQLVTQVTNAEVGFAGPIGIKTDRILVDEEVTKMYNFIVGANKTDHHIKNVNYSIDFKGEIGNFRKVTCEDKCPKCGGNIKINPCFKVATLTKKLDCKTINYDEENGSIKNPYVAKYKIALTRTIALIAEYNRDENGIKWPLKIAPYDVSVIVAVGKNCEQLTEGEKIYSKLKNEGIQVLFDDREDRAGSKFKDCDLIGIPLRITVGKKISEGLVEIKKRTDDNFSTVSIDEAIDIAINYVNL